ncbi:MAG: hypothetical protein IKK57_04485 [Clostridia bacterium]|nr:hypothetical protein [Clostridia bacterium]
MGEMELVSLLESLGVTRRYQGCSMLTEAIVLLDAASRECEAIRLRQGVYQPLANQHGCRWQQVERNLRTVVQRAWNVNQQGVCDLAAYPLRLAPSVGEFLELLLTYAQRH